MLIERAMETAAPHLLPPSPGLNSARKVGVGGHGQEDQRGGVRGRGLVGIHEFRPHLGPELAPGPGAALSWGVGFAAGDRSRLSPGLTFYPGDQTL